MSGSLGIVFWDLFQQRCVFTHVPADPGHKSVRAFSDIALDEQIYVPAQRRGARKNGPAVLAVVPYEYSITPALTKSSVDSISYGTLNKIPCSLPFRDVNGLCFAVYYALVIRAVHRASRKTHLAKEARGGRVQEEALNYITLSRLRGPHACATNGPFSELAR